MTGALEIALAAVVIGGWYAHVRLYPWKTCPRCDGGQRIKGGARVHRDCGRCGSTGRVRRFGAPKADD